MRLLLALPLAGATTARNAEGATARVQYVSATRAYLDAGQAAGLSEGALITLHRDGREVAKLTVVFLSQNSAACRIDPPEAVVRVGDLGTFSAAAASGPAAGGGSDSTRAAPAGPASPPAGPGPSAGAGRSWIDPGLWRGQVVTFYARSSDVAGTYENPTVLGDLRRSGRGRSETVLRIRASRPALRAVTDLPGTELTRRDLRIYEASLAYRSPGGRLAASAGRILPRRLETVGYVDGGTVQVGLSPGLRVGAAAGRGADQGIAGFAPRGTRAGAFVEAGPGAPNATRRWKVLLAGGYVADSSRTRRLFVTQRSELSLRGFALYQSTETDLNPRWKRDLGEPGLTLTAWSAGGSLFPDRRASLTAGIDSRVPVLLPEQRLGTTAPALDRYSGAHAAARAEIAPGHSVRVGASVRRRDRDGQQSRSWDASFRSARLPWPGAAGSIHAMGYDTPGLNGLSADADLSARLSTSTDVELAGGFGATHSDLDASLSVPYRSRWIRIGGTYRGPSGYWLSAAHEWRGGGPGSELRAEAGISF